MFYTHTRTKPCCLSVLLPVKTISISALATYILCLQEVPDLLPLL